MQKHDGGVPRFDMKLPFWGIFVALFALMGTYYAQKESSTVAMTELRGTLIVLTNELASVKASVARMESDRYTASDARRDFAWRDERMVEQGKRITDLEARRR